MNTTQKKNIEKRPGYKHTPLGWIPEQWHVKELISLCVNSKRAIVDGPFGSNLKLEHLRESGIPVINSSYVTGLIFNAQNYTYVDNELFEREIRSKVEPGDIIMAKIGARCGSSAILPSNHPVSILSGNSLKISVDTKYNSTYFVWQYLILTYEKNQFKDYKSVGAQPAISIPYLKKMKMPTAPLPEQRKIAAILSTWDDAIHQTQALIKQLEKRNKGLAQQLLKPKKEWKEVKMSTLFERITDKNEEGNDNVVTISAQRGFVKQETFFKKRVASDTLHNYFLVENGDFCYNKSYSTGYDWGATKRLKDFDKAVVTTLYICFRIKDETKTSGAFFEHFFEAGILNKGLSQIAHEGGRAHGLLNVTPHDFFSLKISVPDIKEQQAIAAVLDKANEELKQQEQYLTALLHQKKGLMQQLLTGAVRVKIDNE